MMSRKSAGLCEDIDVFYWLLALGSPQQIISLHLTLSRLFYPLPTLTTDHSDG